MSEIVRSVIAYFSGVVGSRNGARRRRVQLPLSIALADSESPRREKVEPLTCAGRTLDVSSTGLSFTLPSMCIGSRHIFRETLHVRVELPCGWVTLRAAPTRYDLVEGGGYQDACLVGARIVEIDEASRALLREFLSGVKKEAKEGGAKSKAQNPTSAIGV